MSDEESAEWVEEPEELPRRPRRRLIGAGGNPITAALLAVLLVAGGFIAGVLVEKGQASSTGSSGAGGSLTSRFAGSRGGLSGAGASTGGGGFGGGFGGSAGAGGATVGQVAFVQGANLYVTNTQGNTVEVRTSPGSTVTKMVKASVESIHPGETVIVTGTAGANGSIDAESIRVGASTGAGGLGALFGGAGSGRSGGAGGGGASGGGQALFGGGG